MNIHLPQSSVTSAARWIPGSKATPWRVVAHSGDTDSSTPFRQAGDFTYGFVGWATTGLRASGVLSYVDYAPHVRLSRLASYVSVFVTALRSYPPLVPQSHLEPPGAGTVGTLANAN